MKTSRPVRIAILTDDSNFMVSQTSNTTPEIVGGFEAPFLQLILDALNLRPVQVLTDEKWGRLKDGNWTGLIGKVSRGEADFALGSILMTANRMKVVDFSYPYTTHEITFATKSPDIVPASTALIMPFPPSMWLGIFLSLITFTIALRLFARKEGLLQIGFTLLGILLNQSSSRINHMARCRLLLGSWICGTVILSKIYSSFLLTFLSLPMRESGVKDVNELSKAIAAKTYECYATKESSVLHSLSSSKQEAFKVVAEAIKKNEWFLDTKDKFVKQLEKENTAIIRTRQYLRSLLLDDIFVSDDHFYTAYASIVMRKNYPLKHELNVLIHRVGSSGIYSKFLDHYLFRERSRKESSRKGESVFVKSLTMEHLESAFLVLLLGYVFALFAFGIEMVTWR